jgi:hypothetical protein
VAQCAQREMADLSADSGFTINSLPMGIPKKFPPQKVIEFLNTFRKRFFEKCIKISEHFSPVTEIDKSKQPFYDFL